MYINKKEYLRIILLSIIIFILGVIFLLSNYGLVSLKFEFILLNIVLFIYILGEVFLLYSQQGIKSIITPAVITSVTHFILAFCISNTLLIEGDHYTSSYYTYDYLIKAQYIVVLCCMLFWTGYKAKLGDWIAKILNSSKLIRSLYTFDNNINLINVYIIFSIAILFQFIGLGLGIRGYASSGQLNNSISYSSFSEYITIISSLSIIMFGALAIESYSNEKNKKMKIYMNGFFIILILIGFMMGMKGSVLMPILMLIMAKLLVQKKLNIKFIIIGFVMLIIAYSVIGNFREVLRSSDNLSRMEALQLAITLSKVDDSNQNLTDAVFDRFNETKDFSASIYYKDNYGLGEKDPQFLYSIMVAPLSAIIPRTVWPSKPMSTYGLWFSRAVYDVPDNVYSSTKMSMEGFLYFSGGIFGVLLGIYILGIVMKVVYQFLIFKTNNGTYSKAHFLLYLNFLPLFMYLDTPTSLISNLIRFFFIYPLVIKFIYKKSNR